MSEEAAPAAKNPRTDLMWLPGPVDLMRSELRAAIAGAYQNHASGDETTKETLERATDNVFAVLRASDERGRQKRDDAVAAATRPWWASVVDEAIRVGGGDFGAQVQMAIHAMELSAGRKQELRPVDVLEALLIWANGLPQDGEPSVTPMGWDNLRDVISDARVVVADAQQNQRRVPPR